MESSSSENTAPTATAPDSAGKSRRRGRRFILLALLSFIVLVSVTGALVASVASNPLGAMKYRAQLPVTSLYTRNSAPSATPVGPVAKPGACDCTIGSFLIPAAPGNVPSSGQYIVVSETHEWLWAYQDGQVVFTTPVTTGRPELATPTGLFHVMEKDYGITMRSPWPPGSPYYYYPTYIDYAMLFADGGYFLHNAWWRSDFGPGTNVPHIGPTGQPETGSHGCVQMPTSAAHWLITWVNVGTPVRVDP